MQQALRCAKLIALLAELADSLFLDLTNQVRLMRSISWRAHAALTFFLKTLNDLMGLLSTAMTIAKVPKDQGQKDH
jgi:hypothetical protein